MSPHEVLKLRRDAILRIASARGARHVRVFGSTVRGERGPSSDIDLLVEMEPGRSLVDLMSLEAELTSNHAPPAMPPTAMVKATLTEGGVRVPLIIKAPGLTKPGSTSSVPTITTDFFPTLLALADANGEVKRPAFDGLDMSSVLKGGTEPLRDQLCWHYPHYFIHGKVTPYSVIRRGDMKLIRFWETGKEELYELANDISEARDLAASKPKIRADLAARLDTWLKETGAQIPQKN